MAVASDSKEGGKGFYALVAKFPWLFAILMPVVLIVIIIIGLMDAEIEKNVSEIWVQTDSSYKRDIDYKESVAGYSNASGIFMSAVSRDRGNLFTAARLATIKDRMAKIEDPAQTKVTVDNVDYDFRDLGYLSLEAYKMPYLRITPLDAYQEANYAWDTAARNEFYKTVTEDVVPEIIRMAGPAIGACGPTATGGNDACTVDLSADLFGPLGLGQSVDLIAVLATLNSLEGCSACKQCIDSALSTQITQIMGAAGMTREETEDWIFHTTALGLIVGPSLNVIDQLLAPAGCASPRCVQNQATNNDPTSSTDLQTHAPRFATSLAYGCLAAAAVQPGTCDSGQAAYYVGANDCSNTGDAVFASTVSSIKNAIYTKLGTSFTTANAVIGNPDPIVESEIGTSGCTSLESTGTTSSSTTYTLPLTAYSADFKAYVKTIVDGILGSCDGITDPYRFTSGAGSGAAKYTAATVLPTAVPASWSTGYSLGGSRFPYTGASDADVLKAASGDIYWMDEGSSLGAYNRELTIGGSTPASPTVSNPMTTAPAIQNVYTLNSVARLKERVASTDRPTSSGGPQTITDAQAKEILYKFKEKIEDTWTEGWDDATAGDVQFLAFSDDTGVIGTTGRMMGDVADDSVTLSMISYIVIIVLTAGLLFSNDFEKSQVALGTVGVFLAIGAFLAAIGLTALTGEKINIVQSWTLPFLMVGIGVDDMYIVTIAARSAVDNSLGSYVEAMNSIVVPVSMTSLVNLGIFAAMLLSNVPAVYLTARTAIFAIVFLYLSMITCFPAYVWYDTKRRQAGRKDVLCCMKSGGEGKKVEGGELGGFFYNSFYKKVITTKAFGALNALLTFGLIGASAAGLSDYEIGLDLEDFYPKGTQAHTFAVLRKEYFPAFPATVYFGQLDYKNKDVQQSIIKNFESVTETEHMSTIKTETFWMAGFLKWGSKDCPDGPGLCPQNGGGLKFDDDAVGGTAPTNCETKWNKNTKSLKLDTATVPGVCKTGAALTACGYTNDGDGTALVSTDEYCPYMAFTSDDDLATCLEWWSNSSTYTGASPGYLTVPDTPRPRMPIKLSSGPGTPSLYSINLYNTDKYVKMIKDARAVCDNDKTLTAVAGESTCWVEGIGFSYFDQYVDIEGFAVELILTAVGAGFIVAFAFLAVDLNVGSGKESTTGCGHKTIAALIGALLILDVIVLSVLTTWGLCSLFGVNMTAFALMSYLMSIGFAVEYSVHVVHRFITAPTQVSGAKNRVLYAMEFLTLPTLLAFISSSVGILCMAGSDMDFVLTYFFTPLIVVMVTTYYYGVFYLPALLTAFGNSKILVVGSDTSGRQRSSLIPSGNDAL